MVARLDAGAADFASRFHALVTQRREDAASVDGEVAAIIADVRARGDRALIDYTAKYDGLNAATVGELRVPLRDIDAALRSCGKTEIAALETAARRISDYHARQRPADIDYTDDDGIRLGARWTAIDAVGIYVPGGTAAYPSSVLMNAIPARVAGVSRVAMAVPAPKGALNPLVLAAAKIAGITEIFRIGGAQAIAALAYGTATIVAVDKIVGPGNAYVAAAKRQVFGAVGIDMVAGPSEVVIVADAGNDPAWIAADLLAQAEHDPAAQSILITDDASFGDRVATAVEKILATLPRAKVARESWSRNGAIIVAALGDAPALIDRLAPEHLQLALDDPEKLAGQVRHAGAIFLGRYVPEALGDYVAGPNHVLPTARSARFSSGLGVLDFMKRTSLVGCDQAGFERLAPAAEALARAEGLDAHALSLSVRRLRR
jgi:histidinol dehydrogenase